MHSVCRLTGQTRLYVAASTMQELIKEKPEMPLRRRQQVVTMGGALVAVALSLAACSSSSSTTSSTTGGSTSSAPATGGSSSSSAALSGTLDGSGSTFQATFEQVAGAAFAQANPGVKVNYAGGGSGKGRTDLAGGLVQFAGSDSPIPATETAKFAGKTVLYFPVLIGPITMSYNLPNLSKTLQLSPKTIADIFDGKIAAWNNAEIAADNPGVSLPS